MPAASIRFPETGPATAGRPGLGYGLDLPWGAAVGFRYDAARGDDVSAPLRRFLGERAARAAHLFVSLQRRDRNELDARDYYGAFDRLFAALGAAPARALHLTSLNLGTLEAYDREPIVELTNALVERYDLLWLNEDVGLWSIGGHPLPYPLPPFLTDAGLRAAIENVDEVQAALAAPLLLEFPGFSAGTSLAIGGFHAYDFFRELARATRSPVTLDVGHLLSYQWMRGLRGADLYAELERLPLAHCFEIHLSGAELRGEQFLDRHHGVLLEEQLELLERLLPLCPRLGAVTFEDPRLDATGELEAESGRSWSRLERRLEGRSA